MKRNSSNFRLPICFLGLVVCAFISQGRALAQNNRRAPAKPAPADTVIHNGIVLTSASKTPLASALAIRDGQFVCVGTNKQALAYVGPKTQVINAKMSLITPGFIDAHTHAVWLGMLSPIMSFVYEAEDLNRLKELIEAAAEQSDLPFIFAIGWKYTYVKELTCAAADELYKDRPLILWSHDGHTGWVNTKALERMQQANPDAFKYLTPVYDSDNKPTGAFNHFYTINPFDFYSIEEMGGDAILDKMAAALKAKLAEGLAVGVTCHHDVMIHPTVFEQLQEMNDRGAFADARVRASHFVNHHLFEDKPLQVLADLGEWKLFAENSTEHFVVGESVKLGIDGVTPNHTAFLYEPYSKTKDDYGVASYTTEDFAVLATLIDSMRLQICTHGVGDAGITRIIDGYDEARKANGVWDSRHTIEHCSMIVAKDIKRLPALGIHASMQPSHYFGDPSGVDAVGPERFRRAHRIGTLQKANVPLAFGSDYSIVPMNPLYGLVAAATRVSCLGWPKTKEELKEIISRQDAIRHYTIGSARTLKMDHLIGSLEVGKKADLVMFSVDLAGLIAKSKSAPAPGDSASILDNLVSATFVDGRLVYRRP